MNGFTDRVILVVNLLLAVILANLSLWRLGRGEWVRAAINAALMVYCAIRFVVQLTSEDRK